MNEHPVGPREKALKVNLDPRWYGTFAEIGAGQEVARWFFQVGGASATVASGFYWIALSSPTICTLLIRSSQSLDEKCESSESLASILATLGASKHVSG